MSDIHKPISRPVGARPAFGRAGPKTGPASVRAVRPAQSSARAVAAPDLSPNLEIGRVVSRTFSSLGPHAVTFLALIALAAVPERIGVHLVGLDSKFAGLVSEAMLFLAVCALHPAVVRGTLDVLQGDRPIGVRRPLTSDRPDHQDTLA